MLFASLSLHFEIHGKLSIIRIDKKGEFNIISFTFEKNLLYEVLTPSPLNSPNWVIERY